MAPTRLTQRSGAERQDNVNTSDCISHLGHRRTDHNRHLLGIGHRGNDHGGCPISFGCRCSSGRRRGGNRRHGVVDPVIVVACYPVDGRIDTRPAVSMYFEARSGVLGRPLCG